MYDFFIWLLVAKKFAQNELQPVLLLRTEVERKTQFVLALLPREERNVTEMVVKAMVDESIEISIWSAQDNAVT